MSEFTFGTILQHPFLNGVRWMVICPTQPGSDNVYAMRLGGSTDKAWRKDSAVGEVETINIAINIASYEWVVIDDGVK